MNSVHVCTEPNTRTISYRHTTHDTTVDSILSSQVQFCLHCSVSVLLHIRLGERSFITNSRIMPGWYCTNCRQGPWNPKTDLFCPNCYVRRGKTGRTRPGKSLALEVVDCTTATKNLICEHDGIFPGSVVVAEQSNVRCLDAT